MKKRGRAWPVVPLVLLALGFLFLAPSLVRCVAQQVGRPLEARTLGLGTPPWTNGERAEYEITNWSGQYLGGTTFTLLREGDNWVIRQDWEMPRREEHSVLKLKGSSLKPLSQEKTISTPGGDLHLTTRYLGDKLEIGAQVSGLVNSAKANNSQSLTLDIPLDAYDNDQIPMSLRALPFADGYRATYTNVVPTGTNTVTNVVVSGPAEVDTPAGSFATWMVTIDFGQTRHYLWYQVDEPHYLVKYDNNDVLFVLIETTQTTTLR